MQDLFLYDVGPAPGAPTPVLHLEKVKRQGLPEIKLRQVSGGTYEGFFTVPVHLSNEPPSNREIKVTGRLQVEEAGKRRNYDVKKDGKRWPTRKARVRAVARPVESDGPSSSTGSVSKVKRDGTFTTSTMVGFSGAGRHFGMQVTVELSSSIKLQASVEFLLIDMDLPRLLAFIDPKEKTRPSSQTHLQFLASVRKVYQGGPDDPLKSGFDLVLFRNRNVKVLFAPDTDEGKWLKQNEVLNADGEWVDIGHVLAGIEGSPAQEPDKDQELPKVERPDLIVTWAGDLGSVFQYHMPGIVKALDEGRQPDLKKFITRRVSRADLIGDIDGINIGSAYKANRSLAENLNAYYGKKSLRRFHEFINNSLDDDKKQAFTLEPGITPPKLTAKAREWVAFRTFKYLVYFQLRGHLYKNIEPSKKPLVDKVVQINSPQIAIAADHFARFIEDGLAAEM